MLVQWPDWQNVFKQIYQNLWIFFTIIDDNTKYAGAIPIKNRKGITLTEAFNFVLKCQRKYLKTPSDADKEIYTVSIVS